MKIQEIDKIEKIKTNIVLIKIIDTKGSVPRNQNVCMVISNNNQFGTIGGGELEYRATKESLKLLKNMNAIEKILDFPLGPSLGQCCGGFIKIYLKKYINGMELLDNHNLKNDILNKNNNLYIFGAGHVSAALMNKLDGIDFNVFVIDSREEYLSKIKLEYINTILAKNPEIIIKNAPSNAYYLIMTHSHQIDLSICSSILDNDNSSFIGLIGSETKKIKFYKRLQELGYNKKIVEKIACPIGNKRIAGKEPDVIAISIIARLLEYKTIINTKVTKHIKLVKG